MSELNNLWLAGDANVDLTGFRRPTESEENTADLWRQSKHGFEPRLADQNLPPKLTFTEALANDPGLADEALKRDPKAFREFADLETERIALAFRKSCPAYLSTEKNHAAMLRYLCERFLDGVDHESEEVIQTLYMGGWWHEANLKEAFETLQRRGALDVAEGQVKQLSREELLNVIADLRSRGPEYAIASFLKSALGKRTIDVRKIMVTHADLVKKAVTTVWYHQKAGSITADQFRNFATRRLSAIQLPTLEQIESAWLAYQLEEAHETAEAVASHPTHTERDYSSMSDSEVEAAVNAARKEFALQRRAMRNVPTMT